MVLVVLFLAQLFQKAVWGDLSLYIYVSGTINVFLLLDLKILTLGLYFKKEFSFKKKLFVRIYSLYYYSQ